jgi:hypothetical protein
MKPKIEHVLGEIQKRKTKPFRLEDFLFSEQLKFVSDSNRFKVAVTTRRAGKTVSCAADLVYTAINNRDVICVYITLSRSNAKRIVWPELKKINRQFKLGGVFNASELSATFPSGSTIYCTGAADKSEIEKFRGLAIKKVYIDECQSFPSFIEELVNDIIGPALLDHAGTLCLIGTPGPIPSGYFFNCSRSSNWSKHSWAFWDNPHISEKSGMSHQKVFEEELKRRGVSADHPSIQREWFGKWVLDADSLVYHYSSQINDYEELPIEKWNYILGVDLGYNDADAICLLAWSDKSPNTYLIEEVVTKHQGISELVQQIETLKMQYDITKIVVDTGGLGKKISEELSRRYRIAIQPAEKIRKIEYIELMNDALRTGRLKAKSDSRFAQDCMRVEWDLDRSTPDKKIISRRFHSDICEAVLYAWRESYSYSHTPEKKKAVYGTKEWELEEIARMEAEAEEFFKNQEEANKNNDFEW